MSHFCKIVMLQKAEVKSVWKFMVVFMALFLQEINFNLNQTLFIWIQTKVLAGYLWQWFVSDLLITIFGWLSCGFPCLFFKWISEFNNTDVLAVSVSHEIKACIYKLAMVYTCLRPAATFSFREWKGAEWCCWCKSRSVQQPWQGCVTLAPVWSL